MLASQRLSSELAAHPDAPISYETMAQVLTWAETLYHRSSAAPLPQISDQSTERDYAASQANFANLLRTKRLAMWSVDMMDEGRRASLVTLPRPDTRVAYLMGGQTAGLVMSGFTQHPEQSWRLISYFSQHMPDNRSLIPARRSVAERAGFWKSLDAASTAAYKYALDHLVARPDNTVPHYAEYVEALYAVVQGQQTAARALVALADKGYLDGAPAASSASGIRMTTIVTSTPAAGSTP